MLSKILALIRTWQGALDQGHGRAEASYQCPRTCVRCVSAGGLLLASLPVCRRLPAFGELSETIRVRRRCQSLSQSDLASGLLAKTVELNGSNTGANYRNNRTTVDRSWSTWLACVYMQWLGFGFLLSSKLQRGSNTWTAFRSSCAPDLGTGCKTCVACLTAAVCFSATCATSRRISAIGVECNRSR